MLRVGRLADYGVIALHHLGRVQPARLSLESLAELTHVPLPTVRKVMRLLAEAELVVSKRGPNGGYQIARSPARITLADALAAIDGPVALTECCDEHGYCDIADRCELAMGWRGINAVVADVLERTTLADIDGFARAAPHVPPPLREQL